MRCFYCLAFIFTAVSCSEKIDFSPYHQRKVVVNCVLTPDAKQTLTLTYSNPLNDFYYEKITNATISLFADDEPVGHFERGYYGDWELTHTPQEGRRYRLTVDVPGEKTIEASTVMPFNVPVTKDFAQAEKETFFRKYFVQNHYDVPYWVFVVSKNDESGAVTAKDRLVNSLGTNHAGCDRFNLTGAGMNMLTGQSAVTMEQQVYLRIIPENGKSYSFCVETHADDFWIFFRAASDEYDRYLKTSFQKMLIYQAFDDPSQWFDESSVYSNITNGFGIFGAYSDVIFKYRLEEPPMLPETENKISMQ